MKTNRTAYPENFMVRRVDNKRGGAGSCPNVNLSGGKAAGGIGNLQDAEDFLALGADRLGTSRVVKAVKQMEERK